YRATERVRLRSRLRIAELSPPNRATRRDLSYVHRVVATRRESARTRSAIAVWLALIVVAYAWGWRFDERAINLPLPPLAPRLAPVLTWRVIPAAFCAASAVWLMPAAVRRLRWTVLLVVSAMVAAA